MNIAIVGSRDFTDHSSLIYKIVERYEPDDTTCIISGMASRADAQGELAAKSLQVNYHVFPAKWKRYGRPAGPRRNPLIVAEADVLYAFFTDRAAAYASMDTDHKSGTVHSVTLAEKKGIPVHEYDQLTGVWTSSVAENEAPSV